LDCRKLDAQASNCGRRHGARLHPARAARLRAKWQKLGEVARGKSPETYDYRLGATGGAAKGFARVATKCLARSS